MIESDLKKKIEPTVDAFLRIGFPRYESLVLAILTAIGTATVKEIHNYTEVPLPKVYQTLNNLTRKNLIKQHSKTRPVKYTVFSPDIIIRQIQEENRLFEENLKTELTRISELNVPKFEGEISPFSGIEAFKRIGKGVILNSKQQLSVAMSAETLSLFTEEFSIIKEKGVKLRSYIFAQIDRLSNSVNPSKYKELGFDHHLIELPLSTKPSLKIFNIVKKFVGIIDYIGIIISDAKEAVIILPLFPHETYFGIWICSDQIVVKQLQAYDELFKISKKA